MWMSILRLAEMVARWPNISSRITGATTGNRACWSDDLCYCYCSTSRVLPTGVEACDAVFLFL